MISVFVRLDYGTSTAFAHFRMCQMFDDRSVCRSNQRDAYASRSHCEDLTSILQQYLRCFFISMESKIGGVQFLGVSQFSYSCHKEFHEINHPAIGVPPIFNIPRPWTGFSKTWHRMFAADGADGGDGMVGETRIENKTVIFWKNIVAHDSLTWLEKLLEQTWIMKSFETCRNYCISFL